MHVPRNNLRWQNAEQRLHSLLGVRDMINILVLDPLVSLMSVKVKAVQPLQSGRTFAHAGTAFALCI